MSSRCCHCEVFPYGTLLLCNPLPLPWSIQTSSDTSASALPSAFILQSILHTEARDAAPIWSWRAHPCPLSLKCFMTSLHSWDKNQILNMAHPWGLTWCGMCLIYFLFFCTTLVSFFRFLFPFPSLSHLLWPLPSPHCPVSACLALPSHLKWHVLRGPLPAHHLDHNRVYIWFFAPQNHLPA